MDQANTKGPDDEGVNAEWLDGRHRICEDAERIRDSRLTDVVCVAREFPNQMRAAEKYRTRKVLDK